MFERDWGTITGEEEFNIYMAHSSVEDWMLTIESTSLYSALRELNNRDLELVYLLFVVGFSQKEAAVSLGISQPAIYKKWKRLRSKLKNKLG